MKKALDEKTGEYHKEPGFHGNEKPSDSSCVICPFITGRLIEWNVDVLARLLKQIESRRRTAKTSKGDTSAEIMHEGLIIDEVKEIIELPHTEKGCASAEDHEKIELDKCVIEQLRGYVRYVSFLCM